jgi:two-component system, response regulator YesN
MYKILISDDEVIERNAIKYIINENFNAIFQVFEAGNGKEAIEIAASIKPDIAFFDIKMPVINGLEAAKIIYSSMPECKIILMSAYHYFDYAKDALSVGAMDYITKPAPNDKIVATLEKAIMSLNDSKAKKKKEEEADNKLKQITSYLEEELLGLFATGEIVEKTIKNYFDILNINCKAYVGAVVSTFSDTIPNKVHNEIAKSITKKRITEVFKEKIKLKGYNSVVGYVGQEIYLLLLVDGELEGYESRFGFKLLADVKEEIYRYISINLSIGIGNLCFSIPQIYNSFLQARTSLKYDMTPGSIISYEDIRKETLKSDYAITDFKFTRANALLARVIDYIEKNYEKNITLESAAELVQISPFYLSKLFKQEKNENFIDYVTEIRIKKAKELLSDPMNSVKSVCFQIGYNDPNYFTRVFKKICGVAPTEYKNKNML